MTGRSRLSCGDSALLVAAGSSIGSLYYVMMSTSIPTGANCSFSANIWTDILAFAVGFGLLYLGATHETAAAPPVGRVPGGAARVRYGDRHGTRLAALRSQAVM